MTPLAARAIALESRRPLRAAIIATVTFVASLYIGAAVESCGDVEVSTPAAPASPAVLPAITDDLGADACADLVLEANPADDHCNRGGPVYVTADEVRRAAWGSP